MLLQSFSKSRLLFLQSRMVLAKRLKLLLAFFQDPDLFGYPCLVAADFLGMRCIRQEVKVPSKLDLNRSPAPEFLARIRRPIAGSSKIGQARRASSSVMKGITEMQRMVDEIMGGRPG